VKGWVRQGVTRVVGRLILKLDSCERGGQMRFMVDHMLIKLGKYLRILGYDAQWDKTMRTHELITQANAEGRIFVTRNSRLADQYPEPRQALQIEAPDPVDQLSEVVSRTGIETKRFLFSRCISCNVALEAVAEKAQVRDRVHPNVYARQDEFYRCPGCGTIFWHGSHVRNTCRKLGISMSLVLAMFSLIS